MNQNQRIMVLIVSVMIALGAAVVGFEFLDAAGQQAAADGRELVVIADTTATMQPELNALAAAWPGSIIQSDPADRVFHLLQYKDEGVRYEGNTSSIQAFKGWLNELRAIGGEENCEDAMLRALDAAARGAPDSRVLVLGDSAPQGTKQNFTYVLNRLIDRGVNVYPLISGWCDDSELSQSAMFSLARMTGGFPFIHDEESASEGAKRALNFIALSDPVRVDNAAGGGPKVYTLDLDSTATTLGVETEKCKVWCLTCTLAIEGLESPIEINDDLLVEIRDPAGDLLKPGDPGVEVVETSNGIGFLIDIAEVHDPSDSTNSTWEVRVNGTTDWAFNSAVESGLHLLYRGSTSLRANRDMPLRVGLQTDPGVPVIDPASVQFFLTNVANGRELEIDLFDDGDHGDGAQDDGIYGGRVRLLRGMWYLGARGELVDGTAFQRQHPTPLRVKGFGTRQIQDRQQVAGVESTIQFQLTNEELINPNQVQSRVYELSVNSLLGWSSAEGVPQTVVLEPGETALIDVQVIVPEDAEPGEIEETSLTIVESFDISTSETVAVETTVVDKMTVYLPAAVGK